MGDILPRTNGLYFESILNIKKLSRSVPQGIYFSYSYKFNNFVLDFDRDNLPAKTPIYRSKNRQRTYFIFKHDRLRRSPYEYQMDVSGHLPYIAKTG